MSSLLAFVLLLQGSSTAPVVINEITYDDTSTDTIEYVELYNRSGAPVDVSGWTLGSADPTGPNFSVAIPAATTIAAGGFYTFGVAAVPGVDQVLIAGFLENDNESLTLRDATTAVVDTLIYEANKGIAFAPAAAEGPGIFGNYLTTELAPFGLLAVGRIPDGYDTNNNGRDFFLCPASPDASNNSAPALPYTEDFDGLLVGLDVPGVLGSFVNPKVIDPATIDVANPSAIALSPQGGNAASFWDPSGGGNATIVLTGPTDRVDLECFVYLDAANAAVADYETFSIGVQGTTDTFANHPDPAGLLTANGVLGLAEPNTGVAWEFAAFTTVTGTVATLALVDENDGGTDQTTLGSVSISAGVNDGWQRLRLRVNGSRVDGWFGGAPGTTEGVHFGGTLTAPGPGMVYFGYREFVAVNATARPLTIDALTIRAAEAGVDFVTPPVPCAGSGGCAPRIAWTGGDASLSAAGPFSVDVSNAFSPTGAILVLGAANGFPFPVDLGTLFLPSTGPCYLLQDFPVLLSAVVAGGGACAGTGSSAFPSLAGGIVGGTVYLQYAVIDFVTPLGVPVVMSDGLAVTIQP